MPDDKDYHKIESFTDMSGKDIPTSDKVGFADAVYDVRARKKYA
jgi:hypothetical protein